MTTHLRSNYAPSEAEATAIEGILPTMEADVLFYDEQIRRLEEALSTLRPRRDATKEGIQRLRSLLAPVRRLPRELLDLICSFTIPDYWFDAEIAQHKLVFAQVCHAWREVALDSPALWTHINMSHLDLTRRAHRKQGRWKEMLQAYVRRSGVRPLTFKIWSSSPEHQRGSAADAPFFWQIVAREAQRVRALHLRLPEYMAPDTFPNALPALQTMHVGPQRPQTVPLYTLPLRSAAPALHTLGVYDMQARYLDVNWANLRVLIMPTYANASCEEVLAMLRECTRLEALEIYVGYVDDETEVREGDVLMPCL